MKTQAKIKRIKVGNIFTTSLYDHLSSFIRFWSRNALLTHLLNIIIFIYVNIILYNHAAAQDSSHYYQHGGEEINNSGWLLQYHATQYNIVLQYHATQYNITAALSPTTMAHKILEEQSTIWNIKDDDEWCNKVHK